MGSKSRASRSGRRFDGIRALRRGHLGLPAPVFLIVAMVVGSSVLAACGGEASTTSSVKRTTTSTAPQTTVGVVEQTTSTAGPLESLVMVWNDVAPAGPAPAPRSGASMVYDSAAEGVVLFGGWDVDTDFGDTWVYDPATNTWTDVSGPAAPAPRAHHHMVYDSANGVVIMFGGKSSSGRYADTWAYELATNTWTELTGAIAPSARSVHQLVYDSALGVAILFGGYDDEGELGDTWAYELAANTWTDLQPSGDIPSPRRAHSMAYDPNSGLVILFGGYDGTSLLGDTWAYEPASNTWTELAPAGPVPVARTNHRMVYDEARGLVTLFGGYDGGNDLFDTWGYDVFTNTWVDLDPLGPPPGERESHAMVYLPDYGATVLFGGLFHLGDRDLGDTWALTEFAD